MKNTDIVTQNESRVVGVLSGWDRLVFRACCPTLAYLDGMLMWTLRMSILLKDYSQWALALRDAMKRARATPHPQRTRLPLPLETA